MTFLGIAKLLLGWPLVFIATFLLTTRALPWVVVRILRQLGFRAKATPVTQKRIARFKRIKRGYYSFLAISTLVVTSLFLEVLVNSKPLVIHFDGRTSFPAVVEWLDHVLFFTNISSFNRQTDFGQVGEGEVDYVSFEAWSEDPKVLEAEIAERRSQLLVKSEELEAARPGPDAKPYKQKKFERLQRNLAKAEAELTQLESNFKVFAAGSAFSVLPLYPHSPSDLRHELKDPPPNAPSFSNGVPLGTDMSGRDVVPLMVYGFRISLAFALIVAAAGYSIGIVVGSIQGYFGGWTDIFTQRIQEIWGSIPFLFTIMIIASIVKPSFLLLAFLLVILRSWLGITFYIRGEFYREKAKDYVQAAIGAGVSDWRIMLKHIFPNSIVPVVTFAPFGIVAYIGTLVSLDYLGFGLPPGTPSWGSLLRQGLENVKFYPHLTYVPTVALACTLYCVVMIGEAVREAFDPKVFSRLR